MENVLSAVIIVFILLFGVASLSYTAITTQDTLGTARLAQETRLADQARTPPALGAARPTAAPKWSTSSAPRTTTSSTPAPSANPATATPAPPTP